VGALAFLLSPLGVAAQAAPGVAPLFQEHEPLRLRIEADFKELRDDRDEDAEERDGTLVIIAADGSEEAFPLEIRTRGRFRLLSSTCRFPPLRLDVPRSQMDGTPFEDQDKLKLVTHCRDDDRYEQNAIKEYLVYRIYNLLTPNSFQARLARITYLDVTGEDDTVERWGFIIEAEEALAERLGATVVEDQPNGVHPARIPDDAAGLLNLFEYMVGNTDYSIYGQHNVVGFESAEAMIIPVPYDFDWTGLVNAPYAKPDPSLQIRSVRRRVYRGLCRPRIDYAAIYAQMLSKRDAITEMVSAESRLGDDEREDVLDFLEEFWETLEDPGDAKSRIEDRCRSL
jgi:hypothetical protein